MCERFGLVCGSRGFRQRQTDEHLLGLPTRVPAQSIGHDCPDRTIWARCVEDMPELPTGHVAGAVGVPLSAIRGLSPRRAAHSNCPQRLGRARPQLSVITTISITGGLRPRLSNPYAATGRPKGAGHSGGHGAKEVRMAVLAWPSQATALLSN